MSPPTPTCDQWEGVHQVCDPHRAGTYMRIGDDPLPLGVPAAARRDRRRLRRPATRCGRSSRRGPRDVADDELELIRVAEYTFRAQIADRWRRGNVFLLGDAAHLTPPFIGQGMGAGLRDAMNLAWKLAGSSPATCPDAVLDSYEQERKPHARAMIRLALNVGRAMTGGGELGNLVRRVVVPQTAPHPRPARQGRRLHDARTAPSALVHRSARPASWPARSARIRCCPTVVGSTTSSAPASRSSRPCPVQRRATSAPRSSAAPPSISPEPAPNSPTGCAAVAPRPRSSGPTAR